MVPRLDLKILFQAVSPRQLDNFLYKTQALKYFSENQCQDLKICVKFYFNITF